MAQADQRLIRLLRGGFTAVELTVVIAIGVTLAALAAPSVTKSLRQGQVVQAAALIREAHDRAQAAAQANVMPSNGKHYGVVIVHDSAGAKPYVAVVYGNKGSANHYDDVLMNDINEPIYRAFFSRNALPYLGTSTLASGATRELAWYYQYRTGFPIQITGPAGIGSNPASVGIAARTFGTAGSPIYGWTFYGTPFTATVTALAPDSGTTPGLSIRTPDDRFRRALALYPSGLIATGEF